MLDDLGNSFGQILDDIKWPDFANTRICPGTGCWKEAMRFFVTEDAEGPPVRDKLCHSTAREFICDALQLRAFIGHLFAFRQWRHNPVWATRKH
ncbi:hypothetical protein GCM10017612_23630 [Novosphingobium resinovorum]|nr:hypothetical protein GCM10017612_23630 [Novosphingobium resinovorum]